MKRIIIFLTMLICLAKLTYATHNRAGEITYRFISGTTYEFTVWTYTNIGPDAMADRETLQVEWGDGTSSVLKRSSELRIEEIKYKRNVYKGYHTFPAGGRTYEVVMQDPNRNSGIKNIPNSVNIMFAIKTTIKIDADSKNNSSPILTNPPYDKAAKGKMFVHNPAAYDPDGDSISYKLFKCLGNNGKIIKSFSLPESSHRPIYIDSITGDLIWDAPTEVGKYNLAIAVEEWRKNANGYWIKIGEIIRDMQIEVLESTNNPPVIEAIDKICVQAGDSVKIKVKACDNDFVQTQSRIIRDSVKLTAIANMLEPYSEDVMFYSYSLDSKNNVVVTKNPWQAKFTVADCPCDSMVFVWRTRCKSVRYMPYNLVFKAEDNNAIVQAGDTLVKLSSYHTIQIYVIAPKVKNVIAEPLNNSISVKWDENQCALPGTYSVYRREQPYSYTPDSCETGIRKEAGYQLVASVTQAYYIDDNNGEGLQQGYTYCYRIVKEFENGAKSIVSDEACADLKQGLPYLTNVSIRTTSPTNGSVYVAWAKPTEIDTVQWKPPFRYELSRAKSIDGVEYDDPVIFNDLNDTTFVDTLQNTQDKPVLYRIGLSCLNPNTKNWDKMGNPEKATSVWLRPIPDDNQIILVFDKNIPWRNYEYVVYRKNSLTNDFDSIGSTRTDTFIDKNLKNLREYCYKTKAYGAYGLPEILHPLVNWSQAICHTPIDTTPPCLPALEVNQLCDSLKNFLVWRNPNHYCCDDALYYKIYYAPQINMQDSLIATIYDMRDTTYLHNPTETRVNIITLAGCYTVTAVDSFNNESRISKRICVDKCEQFTLPNVITPNGDGLNDMLRPSKQIYVTKLDIKIYNRWGNLVYQTQNPDIEWRGTYLNTDKLVPDGVYYYLCDVWEYGLTGLEVRNLNGFVHVFANKKNNSQ